MSNAHTHTVEGIIGGNIEIGSFTTQTGQPRVTLAIRNDLGLTPLVSLSEAQVSTLLTCLMASMGDARLQAALVS